MQTFWSKRLYGIMQRIKSAKHYLPEMLTVALIVASLCFWVSQKEGYHMDELLSFELSNAEYTPWIVPTQPEGRLAKFLREEIDGENIGETLSNVIDVVRDTLQNGSNGVLGSFKADVYDEPVWIDRQQFHDYITVEQGDAFNYFSVYFNVKDDNHPPLHFMLLHTVSSLFQERISPWMGCSINLLAIAGCCILLMLIGRKWCGGRWQGITAALLYGMSAGAIATTLLIRMYGVLTFLCLWVLYLHLQKWEKGNWNRKNKLLILVTALGFWTQYFFLFYVIGVALTTVIVMAVWKKRKAIFYYIRSMVIAGIIGVGLFPFAISDVFSSQRGVEALGNLALGLNGYGERLAAFGRILAEKMCAGWIGSVLAGLLLIGAITVNIRKKREDTEENDAGRIVPWLFVLPPLLYFLLAAKMSPYLVDRYIMPLFPMLVLIMVYCIYRCRIPAKICMAVALCLGIISVITYNGEYLFRGYEEQVEIAKDYAKLPCVCVYEGYGFYKNLIEFTEYEQTLLVKPKELEERGADEVLEGANQIIVLVKRDVEQAVLEEMLLDKYGYRVNRVLLAQGVHEDSVWLCER